MTADQVLFLITIVILGGLVLVSYILGAKKLKDINLLWGNLPSKYKKPYMWSMLISALSYAIFTTYLIIQIGNVDVSVYFFPYIILLLSSTLWIPLVIIYINKKTLLTWIFIRVSLGLTAFASLAILMLVSANTPTTILGYAALVSIIIFTLHTGVLDAVVWPYYYQLEKNK